MGLTMTQGVAAELGFKLQKYNYAKSRPEPIDLTGGKVSSNVYDPAKMKTEVAVQAVSPEGKVYVGTIVLDEEESRELFFLTDEAARQEFMQRAMVRQGELALRSEQSDLTGADMLIAKFNQPAESKKE
jgi:hypothetical protein